jgi:pyruvate dehydrogenase E1 component alpha subunit
LIEALTFRFYGHVMGDKSEYMESGELKLAMDNDPIARFRTMLIENKHASTADIEALEAQIKLEVDAAAEFALSSHYPPLDETLKDVYGTEASA